MVEPVHPLLGHRLHARDGPDVVRLSKVVPGDDLSERDGAPVLHEHLPPLREEPVVAAVDEVLVECVRTVVLNF